MMQVATVTSIRQRQYTEVVTTMFYYPPSCFGQHGHPWRQHYIYKRDVARFAHANLKWNCILHHVHIAHYTYMLGF